MTPYRFNYWRQNWHFCGGKKTVFPEHAASFSEDFLVQTYATDIQLHSIQVDFTDETLPSYMLIL